MKILVCITKAPDTTTKVAFSDNDTKLNEAGIQWIINPYDEWYSLGDKKSSFIFWLKTHFNPPTSKK